MQVLLLKDVRKLGHVGDVGEGKSGYARNYLLPQRLATDPSPENIAASEDVRKAAAAERARRNAAFQALADRLAEASATISAAANPEGTLYGSVGKREIAEALQAQGFEVLPEYVMLDVPIRTLDNRVVTLEFTDEIRAQVNLCLESEGEPEDEQQSDDATERPDDDVDE